MRWLVFLLLLATRVWAGSFTVATWNLEFYVDKQAYNIPPKSEASRAKIREGLRRIDADVLALQEIGSTNALLELRASLKKEGLDYPHWQHVQGPDPELHLAFLGKHPFTAVQHHTNERFLLQGRRFSVLRGIGEITVAFPGGFRCTFMTVHLKSKRRVAEADQQAIREEEAVVLREKIDAFFKRLPQGNLLVLGDLNDGISTRTVKTVLGRGKNRLLDTRPHERNGDSLADPARRIVWTHFYRTEELYSRIDYILASPSLKDNYRPDKSYVLAFPDWALASDHRPVVAHFEYEGKR